MSSDFLETTSCVFIQQLVPIIDSRNFNSYGSLEKLPPVLQTWKLRPYRFPLTVRRFPFCLISISNVLELVAQVASHPQFNELTVRQIHVA